MLRVCSWSLLLASAAATNGIGKSNCECQWEFAQTPSFDWRQGSRTGAYDAATYGKGCNAHDEGEPPYCSGSNPPSFCAKPWCFVDATACSESLGRSQFNNAGNLLYFSYATCGSSDSWSNWQSSATTIRQLHTMVDQNLIVLRDQMEAEAEANSGNDICAGLDELCQNRVSASFGSYGKPAEMKDAGVWYNEASSSGSIAAAECLFDAGDDPMVRMGSQEQDSDGTKRAFIYVGDQASGSYLQWPDVEGMCPTDEGMDGWDARLRPWYSTGLTSPKDVMIVVDISGSMGRTDGNNPEARSVLAKKAVKAILKTVTFKDFVNIILFNNGLADQFNAVAMPATEENIQQMVSWVESGSGNWQNGGTNFGAALDATFDLFKASRTAGATSMCQKIVLFLTDGKDDSFTDFAGVQSRAAETGMVIMTYSLGEGADNDAGAATMKRLACDNKGIFYRVPDGSQISNIMAKYYDYFTKGQQICSSSATRYTATNGKETYSACMPMYDHMPQDGLFHPLGVVCYDYNLLESISTIRQQPDWEDFVCAVSDITKTCQILDYEECHLQKLRRAATAELAVSGYDAVCSGVEDGVGACECADPDCKDSETFTDAFGYHCDAWVGDDCNTISQVFDGYTAEQVQIIIAQCKRSCGRCSTSTAHCASADRKCPEEADSFMATCRACSTPKTTAGVGIDGKSMCCPGDRAKCAAADPFAGVKAGDGGGGNSSSDTAAALQVVLPMLAAFLTL